MKCITTTGINLRLSQFRCHCQCLVFSATKILSGCTRPYLSLLAYTQSSPLHLLSMILGSKLMENLYPFRTKSFRMRSLVGYLVYPAKCSISSPRRERLSFSVLWIRHIKVRRPTWRTLQFQSSTFKTGHFLEYSMDKVVQR
jgi:hypothetical protein